MTEWGSSAALAGLVVEAVEWLPSGADSGLVRVRGRWVDAARREAELPALGLRRGDDARRFDSLPDARFARDPAVWRGTYLVPAALMDPAPDELWVSWDSGARAALPAAVSGFEPPSAPSAPEPPPEPEGEVIDRAVLAERRARRAEAAERAQAERAAEALKAVEVLELRGAELERRLESLQEEPALPDEAAPLLSSTASDEPTTSFPSAPSMRPGEPSPAAPSLMRATLAPAAPHPAEAALAEALAAIKRLRQELGEQRHRLRRSELLRAADAVALASFREDKGRARRLQAQLALRERELADALAAAEAGAAEAAAARAQAAEQVALAAQRAASDAAAVRRREAATRTQLEAAGRDLVAERGAHASARERLAARERELAAIGQELTGVRTELATVRRDAEARAGELERRLGELETALVAERAAHGATATERETARAGLALAESARSAETVARAALDDELERERAARATLAAALAAAQADLTAALTTQSDIALSREQARAEAARLRADRDAAVASEAAASARAASAEASIAERDAALVAAVDRAASAEASVAERDAALVAARDRIAELDRERERETGGLVGRIAELERAADDDLARRAREQTEAASAAERVEGEDRREVAANLDAAAAALRARTALEEPPAESTEPAVEAPDEAEPAAAVEAPAEVESATPSNAPAGSAPPAEPAESGPPAEPTESAPPVEAPAEPTESPPPVEAPAEPTESAPPVEAPAASAPPVEATPEPARSRPTIVTEAKHPPRGDVVGSSKRQYPWLRGALVKLAHDDPRAATRFVLGLVPVQHLLISSPLEYDLTIRGSGTYAVSVGEQAAAARSIGEPRPRGEASFHASADIVTLTELLAGVEKRLGRWIGSVRVHGRRREAEALRAAIAGSGIDLAAAARAGADLDPDLVLRAFAYAIHPSWTKGHAFTIAQELAGPRPLRWHVAVRDGKPVTVERRAPAQPPDAVVSMTRTAFSHLLRGENSPSGERPTVRGDRAAVALLKGWTERAQGR